MSWWQWSRTSANNATADPSINYSVGMSPSSVDASGRAMMARTAEFRDDTSGLLVTAGAATAFTITTYEGLPATPNDGQLIAFTMHVTNGVSATLTADGGNTYPLQSSSGIAVPSAVLVAGTPYTAKFSAANSAWMMRDFYGSSFVVPIGGLVPYIGATSPNSNFVLPYGQAISRTTYSALFALVGTTFGVGDGVTTFNVPDLRGCTIAAIDNLGGTAANRLTTTYFGTDPTVIGDVGGAQSHTLTQGELSVALGTATSTVTDLGHDHVEQGSGAGGATTAPVAGNQAIVGLAARTQSSTTGITVATTITNAGGGNAHAIVQPTMVISYLLRVA